MNGTKQTMSAKQKAPEEPKRLKPTDETLRKLYLYSGNRCAFPGCKKAIVDADGDYIAEVCHIEAAEKRGERFNKDQTNEQRRSFENLILFCRIHHKKTNNVKVYRREKLWEIKAAHENKYSHAIEKMASEFEDHSFSGPGVTPATNLGLMKPDVNHLEDTLKEVNTYAQRVQALPPSTRKLLMLAVRRARATSQRQGKLGGNASKVNPEELRRAIEMPEPEFSEEIEILTQHNLASIESSFEGANLCIWGQGYWNDLPEDLIAACEVNEINPERIFCELRFDLLDRQTEHDSLTDGFI